MKKDLNLYNKNAYHVPRKNKRRIYRNNIVKLLRETIKPSIGSQAEQTRYLPKKSKKKKSQPERSMGNTVCQTLWIKNF